jgi:branched-chain amino acid transport system substrate-binding protein
MAFALDSIRTGGDRDATVQAARATKNRDSIIGRYSVDDQGHTTSTAYGRLAVVDGRLVWDLEDLPELYWARIPCTGRPLASQA